MSTSFDVSVLSNWTDVIAAITTTRSATVIRKNSWILPKYTKNAHNRTLMWSICWLNKTNFSFCLSVMHSSSFSVYVHWRCFHTIYWQKSERKENENALENYAHQNSNKNLIYRIRQIFFPRSASFIPVCEIKLVTCVYFVLWFTGALTKIRLTLGTTTKLEESTLWICCAAEKQLHTHIRTAMRKCINHIIIKLSKHNECITQNSAKWSHSTYLRKSWENSSRNINKN